MTLANGRARLENLVLVVLAVKKSKDVCQISTKQIDFWQNLPRKFIYWIVFW